MFTYEMLERWAREHKPQENGQCSAKDTTESKQEGAYDVSLVEQEGLNLDEPFATDVGQVGFHTELETWVEVHNPDGTLRHS